jgi:hypothetical protein
MMIQVEPLGLQTVITLAANPGVAKNSVIVIPQSGTPADSYFVIDGLGRVSLPVAGTISISITFSCSGPNGSGLLRLVTPSTEPNLSASVFMSVPADGAGIIVIKYDGFVTNNTSFEVDFQNGSNQIQNQLSGTFDIVYESAAAAGEPVVGMTLLMNPQITAEVYNAFLSNLQAFVDSYSYLIERATWDTIAPTVSQSYVSEPPGVVSAGATRSVYQLVTTTKPRAYVLTQRRGP